MSCGFYLTSDRQGTRRELVFKANDRCDQENLIAHLRGCAQALWAAVDNLVSYWAHMVMTALAWNLKAWFALSVPEHPRHKAAHRAPDDWDDEDTVEAPEPRPVVSVALPEALAPEPAREQAQEPQGPEKPREELGAAAVPTGTKPPDLDEENDDEDDPIAAETDYGATPS